MCGIAGILGLPEAEAAHIARRMLDALSHRGPDDHGLQIIPTAQAHPVVLVHRRLAILDLSPAGHQPMVDAGERGNWITFNGEIFNYQELWPELQGAGWPCRTRCDTEVILHAYRVWGEACVQRFRGMFAWCLVDQVRDRAWFCRDRLGIKPLYVFRPRQGGMLFASELRTLLAAGEQWVPPNIDESALESFLSQGAVIGPQSIVRGVQMLEPGESLLTDLAGREIGRKTYWQLPSMEQIVPATDRPRAVKVLGEALREAVSLRLISDRPLGLFLSSGIDSTCLAALATEVAGTRLRSISVGFDQPGFDESAGARRVAESLGTDHVELCLSGSQLLEDLPAALAAMDQPTVDGFNTYFVSRAARQAGLTVALSGLGGDELFGGYASFTDVPRAAAWQQRLQRLPGAAWVVGALARRNRRSSAKIAEILRRPASMVHMYLLRRELFLTSERRRLMASPAGSDVHAGIPDAVLRQLAEFEASGTVDPPNVVSRLELSCYMRHMLLRDADVFSMAGALELRVPLLDHVLVEQVARLPGDWKRADPRPKPLLIDAVGPRFPEWVCRQPKRGFTFPWDPWLRGPLRSRAEAAARDADCWLGLGIDAGEVAGLWQRFCEGDKRVAALQVLGLVVLQDFASRHGLRRLPA